MKSSRNHFVRLSFISARHFRRRSGRWFIENLCTSHHFHLLIQSTSSSLIHLVSFALNIVILLLLVASFFGERNYERSFNGTHLFRNLKFISFGGPLLEERSAILMQNSKKNQKRSENVCESSLDLNKTFWSKARKMQTYVWQLPHFSLKKDLYLPWSFLLQNFRESEGVCLICWMSEPRTPSFSFTRNPSPSSCDACLSEGLVPWHSKTTLKSTTSTFQSDRTVSQHRTGQLYQLHFTLWRLFTEEPSENFWIRRKFMTS